MGIVLSVGSSCFMAKLYIKHDFRLCPVHPSDWPLLGYVWQNNYVAHIPLPFGSRSSPFIFSKFSDALLWILIFVFGIPIILLCLDDYLLSSASDCQHYMDIMQSAFSELGVPLAPEKLIGPSTKITYLGIEIDSVSKSIHSPTGKLQELQFLLDQWKTLKKCTKRELLSLLGSLSFACKDVKPGKMLLRR